PPVPPAFRERLSDVEAASTGSFSRASGLINGWLHGPCRPGKAYAATRRKCRYVIPYFSPSCGATAWGIVPVDPRVSINPGKGIIVIFQHPRDDLSLSIAGQEVNSSWRGAGIKKAVT
ncbi:hypothetical protein, partial [Klebsiella quasipneumoniae]|uniref:hypothetical protein n=1 Tax=Klebsiella quasipneumoniae TaxID=1463165 RepID=UPI0022476CD4